MSYNFIFLLNGTSESTQQSIKKLVELPRVIVRKLILFVRNPRLSKLDWCAQLIDDLVTVSELCKIQSPFFCVF